MYLVGVMAAGQKTALLVAKAVGMEKRRSGLCLQGLHARETISQVSYAFKTSGTRQITFKASRDKTSFGASKTPTIKVDKGLPKVTSVNAPTETPAKTPVTFTVRTETRAKYLALFSESGAKMKVWGMTNNSTVSGDVRTWTVSYTISNTGNRVLVQ